ncbi:MAG: spore maturation protein [Oscillospiraceae bacterium]|nr:spore maturation protein [Oscillospiraceae bacterium]MCM0708369.1 spore maturation protein [Faecalicatena sp. BF-R-105]MDY3218700.1 spore maturation protein [Candidatus Fimivivens sp.]SFI53013.1 spore maturation protein B [Ruminococcaceae bacterium D5]GKH50093.1 spore maturation protein B [Eubacteriales bacterium]
MSALGDWAIPSVIFLILLAGWLRGINVFDCFLEGAREGISTAFEILPSLVALILSIGIFRASGALDLLTAAAAPLARLLLIPGEVVPLALLRPISGSGALVIFQDLLTRFGPDSMIGRIASVMEGSTETTFYTIAVYYGAASIRRTRHTLPAALFADLTGFLMSALTVRWLFYS